MGKVRPVNHASWVAVVTPTDRPYTRSEIAEFEHSDGTFVLLLYFLHFSL